MGKPFQHYLAKNSPLLFLGAIFGLLGPFWIIAFFLIRESFAYLFLGLGVLLLLAAIPCLLLGIKANRAFKKAQQRRKQEERQNLKKQLLEEIRAELAERKKSRDA